VIHRAPPYFPSQTRAIQRQYSLESLDEAEKKRMRDRCKRGQEQIETANAFLRGDWPKK
jgi:hypothetical protein